MKPIDFKTMIASVVAPAVLALAWTAPAYAAWRHGWDDAYGRAVVVERHVVRRPVVRRIVVIERPVVRRVVVYRPVVRRVVIERPLYRRAAFRYAWHERSWRGRPWRERSQCWLPERYLCR